MKLKINNKTFNVEEMNTSEELAKGMMGRDNLDGCMLFNVGKGQHSFWMKDCKIPLDIIYCSNNRITKIYNDCQPCDDCNTTYKGIGDKVLEFPGGTAKDFKIGDKIFLINN